MDLSTMWVVTRQDASGDRYFVGPGGYLTTDFFVATKFHELGEANQLAMKGNYQVLSARVAYQLTVVFDQREHASEPA